MAREHNIAARMTRLSVMKRLWSSYDSCITAQYVAIVREAQKRTIVT